MRHIETKFLHAGRVIVSTPGMHETGDIVTRILADVHNNEVYHLKTGRKDFANREDKPKISETVRGEHVFLLADLQFPNPDQALGRMERLADGLMRASADDISLVAPYLPFLRQDRKDEARAPISAKIVAKRIEMNRAIKRVITLDMHAPQVQGFFEIPVDDMPGLLLHAEHLRQRFGGNFGKVTIVAPDVGSAKRAQKLAKLLGPNVRIAIIDKRRQDDGETEVFAVIGNVRGRHCILCDDMIDGGGTIRSAEKCLKGKGALSVSTYATHLILSGDAEKKFAAARSKVFGTQTIPRSLAFRKANARWLTFLPYEPLLATLIHQASIVGGSMNKLAV